MWTSRARQPTSNDPVSSSTEPRPNPPTGDSTSCVVLSPSVPCPLRDRAADLLRLLSRDLDFAGQLPELPSGLAYLLAQVGHVDLHARHWDAEDLAVLLKRCTTQQHATGHADGPGHGRDRHVGDRL